MLSSGSREVGAERSHFESVFKILVMSYQTEWRAHGYLAQVSFKNDSLKYRCALHSYSSTHNLLKN